jgi:hypothetical protein
MDQPIAIVVVVYTVQTVTQSNVDTGEHQHDYLYSSTSNVVNHIYSAIAVYQAE